MVTWLLLSLTVRAKVLTLIYKTLYNHLCLLIFLNPLPFLCPLSFHSDQTIPLAIFSNIFNLFPYQSFVF